MSLRTYIAGLFKPVQVPDVNGDSSVNRNFRSLASAFVALGSKIEDAIDAAATPATQSTRVFVSTVTGVGPWAFTGLNGDEADLLGYEFELAIVDPTGDVGVRLNGDAGANYGDTSGIPLNQADVGPNPGGPPGGVRGVVEIRGVATGNARTIGCARVTSFETTIPSVSVRPPDVCWTGIAALTDASVFVNAGAAGASSAVSLYKIMKVTA